MVVVSRARHTDMPMATATEMRPPDARLRRLRERSLGIGVVSVPPPEERRWEIDRHSRHNLEPGLAKLRLKPEAPGDPLRRRPGGGKHDQHDDGDLTPEYLGCGHGRLSDMVRNHFQRKRAASGVQCPAKPDRARG